jgi:DNA-binding MarR family transcriptional regulator
VWTLVWTTLVPADIVARMAHATTRRTKTRRFDSLEQEAYLNLWRTYDRLRGLEDELFVRHDLTPQQYNALRILRGEHPAPIATLALQRRLVSRAPDITRMLDKLERRELIVRERPDQNRRTVRIGISPAGLALLRELDGEVRQCHVQQLGHMTRGELQDLVRLLHAARGPHEDTASVWG